MRKAFSSKDYGSTQNGSVRRKNCAQNHFLSGTASNKQGVTACRTPVNDTVLIKKSQRTLVKIVDNRRFLCYNKPATWKKVFFLCLKLLKYEQQKQGRNEETAADPQGSQAITQIHSGGGSRARKNHIGMY